MQICGCTIQDLQQWLTGVQEKPFRAQQIFEWIYRKQVSSFEEMTNLPLSLRESLAKEFLFPTLKLIHIQESDETRKFLWELADGNRVESVLISSFDRRTVCLSSQVGCPARCSFCASGKQGLIRSLSPAEIVEQALHINRLLRKEGSRVSHLVYMGMGEPLENYDAVMRSIRIFIDECGMNLSQRRITISTVGILEGIEKLTQEQLKINLVLSLHAPNQHLRKKLIPFARKYSLEQLLAAIEVYAKKTKRDPTFEYTLIAQMNDGEDHARELAALLKNKQCTVNLIPYNPIEGIKLSRPSKETIVRFRSILQREGINTTWRYTKGEDIAAACGQLALQPISH